MGTSIEQFNYDLPEDRIAQHSAEPRDHSKLMILNRESGEVEHKVFYEILGELESGDLLVMNKSKVFKARLRGKVAKRELEVFLLRGKEFEWEALIKRSRKISVGDQIDFGGLTAEVMKKNDKETDNGIITLKMNADFDEVIQFTDQFGEIPTPPYVIEKPASLEEYQTVYAKDVGSVAAPTAGFHFTEDLIAKLEKKGVEFAFVTLHVGLGTFVPMKVDTLEEHEMHREFVRIDPEVARKINDAKRDGRRVIAVGTTTVRSLEGAEQDGRLAQDGFAGDVNLFITPGYTFQIVDALITNFHLPKSTLLVLVSAFAGREHILAAYAEAITQNYRFFSFGDAMFID